MKSLSLITQTKITSDKVSDKLIASFPFKKKITKNDSEELFVGSIPNEFYIIFNDSMSLNDSECLLLDETKEKLPFKECFVNELFYRNDDVAKFVISILASEFPELYIENDDGASFEAANFLMCN